jgi:hypothetical protein
VLFYLDRATEVIQDHGSRTSAGEAIGFRNRVTVGELLSNLAHEASQIGGIHLASEYLEKSCQYRGVSLGEALLRLGTDGVRLGRLATGPPLLRRNHEAVPLERGDVASDGVSGQAECGGELLDRTGALPQ